MQYYGKHEALEGRKQGLRAPVSSARHHDDTRPAFQHRLSIRRDPVVRRRIPNGPGRPDRGDCAAREGHQRNRPTSGSTYHDAGFVEYWWRRDAQAAADWFLRGSKLPTAPNWLQPLAASVLAEGGDQLAARVLWTQMAQTAEQEWMRQTARTRLAAARCRSGDRAASADRQQLLRQSAIDSRQAGTR